MGFLLPLITLPTAEAPDLLLFAAVGNRAFLNTLSFSLS